MRKRDLPLDESYIRKEQTAFEEAIRKVEAEQMSRANRNGSAVPELKKEAPLCSSGAKSFEGIPKAPGA